MAKELILKVETNTSKSIKSISKLDKEIEGLKNQIAEVEDQGTFDKLAKQLANANSELRNLELQFEGLDIEQKASEFGSFSSGLADIATGAFAVANAMGFVDSSNEEALKTMVAGFAVANTFRTGLEGIVSAQKLLRTTTILTTEATGAAAIAQRIFNFIVAANPIFLLIGALTAAVAAFALYSAVTGAAKDATELLNDAQKEAIKTTSEEAAKLDTLTLIIQSETTSRFQKNKAVKELQDQYPEFLSNIDLEKTTTEDLTKAIEQQIKLIDLRAQAEALAEIKAEAFKKIQQEQLDVITKQNVGWFEYALSLNNAAAGQVIVDHNSQTNIANGKEEIKVINGLIEANQTSQGALTKQFDIRSQLVEITKEQAKNIKKLADEAERQQRKEERKQKPEERKEKGAYKY